MSLFTAVTALKKLGDDIENREVIINDPLTTTITGPANDATEIPTPLGLPMATNLRPTYEDLTGIFPNDTVSYSSHSSSEVSVQFVPEPARRKSAWETGAAFLGMTNVVLLNDAAGVSDSLPRKPKKEKQSSNDFVYNYPRLNLNNLDDPNAIRKLMDAYEHYCDLEDDEHEVCSTNLRKAIIYQDLGLIEAIITSHAIKKVDNPYGVLPPFYNGTSIINMLDVFRVTPLILAARMGNREIVEMLLSHGADPTVHTHEGETALSVAAKKDDESMIELLVDFGADPATAICMLGLGRPFLRPKKKAAENMYGFNFEPVLRLAQPKFIVRTSNPILTAFRCGSIIKKIGDKKDEYMAECDMLLQQTDDFAYYYLDQCKSMWEAMLLLKDKEHDLLMFAIHKKKMKIISHHYCQQYIMDFWYGGVQHGKMRATAWKFSQLLLMHIFIPIYIPYLIIKLILDFDLMNYLGPKYSKAYTTWRSLHIPSLTYCVDFFNFMILIISLLVTCLDVSDKPIYLSSEVVLWGCLGARFMVEMDKIRLQGKKFFKNTGNCIDLTVSCVIVLTIVLRIMQYYEDSLSLRFTLWTSYLYALCFLFLVLRMLEMLDVSYVLGPLEGAIGNMMMDLVKVSILVLICTFGFSVSMYTISKQSYRVNTNETMEKLAKASNNTLTLTELTALAAKTVTISEAFNTFGQTSWTLFWTLFGMPELSSITIAYDEFASYYLKVLYSMFLVAAVILFLNMLIAMLTDTYVNVTTNAEVEWKYARSAVVFKYAGTHPFIWPFNLILYPIFFFIHLVESKRKRDEANRPETEKERMKETYADQEMHRQSALLHKIVKTRFMTRFKDVIDIPYWYKVNIFHYFKTFPFKRRQEI